MAQSPNTTWTQGTISHPGAAAPTSITMNGHPVSTNPYTISNNPYTTTTLNNVFSSQVGQQKHIAVSEIIGRFEAIEKQLMIINRDKLLEEKYPALKDAYEQYMLILKLVSDEPEDNQ